MSDFKPIQLTPTLRINFGDKNQYVIEQLSCCKSGDEWSRISFCTSLRGLATTAREKVMSYYARQAGKAYDEKGLGDLIMQLPKKTGK